MEIYIDHELSSYRREIIEKAINYFIDEDLPSYVIKNLSIDVLVDDEMTNSADIVFISKREYCIHVNPKLKDSTLISSIFHELVHLDQFIRGRLQYLGETDAIFDGLQYSLPLTPYFKRPWEIEAYGKEVGLYIEFINFLGENNLKKWKRE